MAQGTTLGIAIAKNVVFGHGVDTPGHVVVTKRLCPAEGAAVCRPAATLPHWHGSLGRGALLGAGVYHTGAHGETAAPAVCQTVCAEPKK